MVKKQAAKRLPLDRCHLYGLRSPQALANRLGWQLDKLESLAKDGGYSVYPHPQTGRRIEEPGKALQSLHKQVHRYLARLDVPEYLHSSVKKRSYLTNAQTHVGVGGLIKVDIAKFYRKVPQHRVMHFFRDQLNCAPDVAGLIANLICFDGHLPTGSSVSPIMSFWACRSMFNDLADLANSHDLRMSCYVDDVTMSGERATIGVLRAARSIIFREGFTAHKDRYFAPQSAKLVTGIVVGADKIMLPHSRWKKINDAINAIHVCATDVERLILYPRLVSRLYEATQIDPRCRRLAEFHHEAWRTIKRDMLTVKPGVVAATSEPLTATSI
ncbi:reverse transcriptase family protein [Croceibacterium sp. TMG7-5b_MA50]|uniref:reverse transcriptase family protein n=1 Tax=Croceibacterium sp. TMG7-5b_MA50 TaxID=3121290 RepID=UPI0032214187